MTTNDPKPFDESLLTGYLDGELTPLEVQEVEAALASSPQLKSLFSELQQIRDIVAKSTLKTPRWNESHEDSQRTPRASRVIRSGPWLVNDSNALAPSSATGSIDSSPTLAHSSKRSHYSKRHKRIVAASLLATAASVVALIAIPEWQGASPQVSQATPDSNSPHIAETSANASSANVIASKQWSDGQSNTEQEIALGSQAPVIAMSSVPQSLAPQSLAADGPIMGTAGASGINSSIPAPSGAVMRSAAPSASFSSQGKAHHESYSDAGGTAGLSMSVPVIEDAAESKTNLAVSPPLQSLGMQLIDSGIPAELVRHLRVSQASPVAVELFFSELERNDSVPNDSVARNLAHKIPIPIMESPPIDEATELRCRIPESIWQVVVRQFSHSPKSGEQQSQTTANRWANSSSISPDSIAVVTVDLTNQTSELKLTHPSEDQQNSETVETFNSEPTRQLVIRMRNFPAK